MMQRFLIVLMLNGRLKKNTSEHDLKYFIYRDNCDSNALRIVVGGAVLFESTRAHW